MGSKIDKDCIFCGILAAPGHREIIYEDDLVFAFDDINKRSAREHILVCPKEHIANDKTLQPNHVELIQHMRKIGNMLLDKIDPVAPRRYRIQNYNDLLDWAFMFLLFIQLIIYIFM